ncbi:MAG: pseudouridine synthase [Candidatus Omnitrophota bacterium]
MNLNMYLTKAGFCARRKATTLVKEGKVSVNGKIVLEPWHEVAVADEVAVNDKKLRIGKIHYLAVNKPSGVTVTLEDRHAITKISDVIPKSYGRLFPVGRLDKNSRGLLIMTNDGDLCQKLTHPKFEIEKEYVARVRGALGTTGLAKIQQGVRDGDDDLTVRSCSIISSNENVTVLKVVAIEGKKRHIRRLLEQTGYSVMDLQRVRIGSLKLGALREGEYEELTRETIYRATLGADA